MANKVYTEPIAVKLTVTAKDTAGGNKATSVTVDDSLNATLVMKEYRRSDQNGKLTFQNVYEVSFWVNPSYEITTSHFIEWRSKKLVIQNVTKDDKMLKYHLVCVAN